MANNDYCIGYKVDTIKMKINAAKAVKRWDEVSLLEKELRDLLKQSAKKKGK